MISGKHAQFKYPLYVPDLLLPLVSPQHWGQAIGDQRGTYMINNGDECTICWGGGKHCRTIQHDKSTNTPTLRTAAVKINYHAFEACFQAMDASLLQHHIKFYQLIDHTVDLLEKFVADELIHQGSHQMPDSEGAVADDETIKVSNDKNQQNINHAQPCPHHPTDNHKWGEFTLFEQVLTNKISNLTYSSKRSLTNADQQNDHKQAKDDQAKLMRWYHGLCHLSFKNLKILAKNGEIPKQLSKVKPPKCASCIFGAMKNSGQETKANDKLFLLRPNPMNASQSIRCNQMNLASLHNLRASSQSNDRNRPPFLLTISLA